MFSVVCCGLIEFDRHSGCMFLMFAMVVSAMENFSQLSRKLLITYEGMNAASSVCDSRGVRRIFSI